MVTIKIMDKIMRISMIFSKYLQEFISTKIPVTVECPLKCL